MKDGPLKTYAILGGVLLLALALVFAHFKVWQLIHPDAPAWTYIFR